MKDLAHLPLEGRCHDLVKVTGHQENLEMNLSNLKHLVGVQVDLEDDLLIVV